MSTTASQGFIQVRTAAELKAAILGGAVGIEVVDPKLAKTVLWVKRASVPVLAAAAVAAGIGVAALMTPAAPMVAAGSRAATQLGWHVARIAADKPEGSIALVVVIGLLVILGGSAAFALLNGYDMEVNAAASVPGMGDVSGSMKLKKRG